MKLYTSCRPAYHYLITADDNNSAAPALSQSCRSVFNRNTMMHVNSDTTRRDTANTGEEFLMRPFKKRQFPNTWKAFARQAPFQKKKCNMLETRGKKQLDRTGWCQTVVSRCTVNRIIRTISTNSNRADGLTSIKNNCSSLTLSYKSWSKNEFCELAPSGCSRLKNRSHSRSIEQWNLFSSQWICEFSEILFWRKSRVHSRIGAK